MKETLPTFVVIGASKSGTTSLARYLSTHPDVFMCHPKEPDFFHPDRGWKRGLAWYESLFEGGRRCVARGEASTCYTWAPHVDGVPRRMSEVVPDARLVYLVRDPIERIRSMYLHRLDRGLERASFREAIRRDPLYVDSSRYAFQLERFLEWFPRDRILIASSERLRDDREATIRRVLAFVGVDPDVPLRGVEDELQTRASKRRSMGPRVLESARVRLRASPWYHRSPAAVKRALMSIRRTLSRPVSADDAVLSPDLEHDLREQLAEDMDRFRKLTAEDFSWALSNNEPGGWSR